MQRRALIGTAASVPMILTAAVTRAQIMASNTYVLVHGTWCGGWFFGPLAENLRQQRHRVFTPTHTGSGDRRHLLSSDITLETFVVDVMNLIEAEELTDIILVGHSSAGLTITAVADRMPDRVKHLVYLDAVLVTTGQNFLSSFPPDAAVARRKAAREINGVMVLPPPSPAAPKPGAPEDPISAWLQRRFTPYPFAPFETPLVLANSIGNGRPSTYVAFTKSPAPLLDGSRQLARSQTGWQWAELLQNHGAPAFAPAEVADLLRGIG